MAAKSRCTQTSTVQDSPGTGSTSRDSEEHKLSRCFLREGPWLFLSPQMERFTCCRELFILCGLTRPRHFVVPWLHPQGSRSPCSCTVHPAPQLKCLSGLVSLPPSLEDGQLCVQPVTTTQEEKHIIEAQGTTGHRKDFRMQGRDDEG